MFSDMTIFRHPREFFKVHTNVIGGAFSLMRENA